MKRSGPPKKPTHLKLLEGTFRADRAVKNEPKPPVKIPSAPTQMSELAKTEWRRVAKELATLGMLATIDRALLAAYCETWADFVDATEQVKRFGKVIKTQGGNVIENPYYSIKKRSSELMHKFAVEFGMTPAARTRINVDTNEEKEDDFASFVKSRKRK